MTHPNASQPSTTPASIEFNPPVVASSRRRSGALFEAHRIPLHQIIIPQDHRRRPLDPALRASIEATGMLVPILVTPGGRKGTFDILDGHMRVMIALDRKHREIAAIVVDETNSSLEYLIVNHVRRKLGSFELAGRIGEQVATGIARSELAAKLGMSESALSKYCSLRKIREADRNEILGMVSEPAFELLYSLASVRDEGERAAAMASIREGEPVKAARARRSAASGGRRRRKVSPRHNRPAVDLDTRDMGIMDYIRVFQNFIEFGKNASPVDDENSRELAGLWRPVSLVFARCALGSSVIEGEIVSSAVDVSEGLQPAPRLAGVDGRLFSLVETRAGEILAELRDKGSWPPGLSPRTVLSAGVKLISAVNANNRNRRASFRAAYFSSWA